MEVCAVGVRYADGDEEREDGDFYDDDDGIHSR